ncbi:hypothetical protein SEA_MARGARET_6 [Gordonia phage Margaret]|nr:hypothetical protein SEA_MARGARET_6 [Gordonia phage Margaret]
MIVAATSLAALISSYTLGGVMAKGRKRGTPSKGTKKDKRFKKNK